MRLVLACMLLLLGSLPCHGQITASAADTPVTVASPLEGNWQLSGDRSRQQYPLLSMFVHVEGTHLTATGDEYLLCQGTQPSAQPGSNAESRRGAGGSLALRGELSPDGSFVLAPVSPRVTVQLTITGTAPRASHEPWRGAYTVMGQTSRTCLLDQTGTFTATPLSPLPKVFTGGIGATYSQVLPAEVQPGSGDVQAFRLEITQGAELAHARRAGSPVAYLPLAALLEVHGSPCFQRGAATSGISSQLAGDTAQLQLSMDDGSMLSLSLVYADPEAKGLIVQAGSVRGGRCDGQAFYGRLEGGENHAPQPGMVGGTVARP